MAICASGNYLAGTVWPPVVERLTAFIGWRHTYMGVAAFVLVTMVPLTLLLRKPAPMPKRSYADG